MHCCQVMLAVCSGAGDVSMTRFELCEVRCKCASLWTHNKAEVTLYGVVAVGV